MRKNVCITYHMSKENEVAETCITIPMDAAVADDVLSNQEHSRYVKEVRFHIPLKLRQITQNLLD